MILNFYCINLYSISIQWKWNIFLDVLVAMICGEFINLIRVITLVIFYFYFLLLDGQAGLLSRYTAHLDLRYICLLLNLCCLLDLLELSHMNLFTKMQVTNVEAVEMARTLALEEGLLVICRIFQHRTFSKCLVNHRTTILF